MVEFNEGAFRTKATAKGYTAEQIDSYIATKAAPEQVVTPEPTATPELNQATDIQTAGPSQSFEDVALAKGFTKEQISAYTENKVAAKPVTSAYAKPSLDLPFSVKPQYRKMIGASDEYINPVKLRNSTGGISFRSDEEYEQQVRNQLPNVDIARIAAQLDVDPTTQEGINVVYSHAERENSWKLDKQDLLAGLQELTNVDNPFGWIKSNFSTAADKEYQSIKARNIENIAALAKERGIDLVYEKGKFGAYDEAGNLHEITPDYLDQMGKAKYEMIGGIAGSLAGARVPVSNPVLKLGAVALGGLIGTIAGDQVDYLSAAITAQETLDEKVALEKALGTAQFTALLEVGLAGTGKLIKGTSGSITRAFNFVKDGNTAGAYIALKDTLGYISDDEAMELVARWEKLHQQAAPGNSPIEKAIAVLPSTAPGGDAIIKAAAKKDPRVGLTVRADLNTRAKDMLKLAKNASDDTGVQLRTALTNYRAEVSSAYQTVKVSAGDHVPANYQFNLTSKSIQPALEATIDEIADPAVAEKLLRTLTKIESLTTSRTFDDLLDLRELLNEFKYANKVTSKSKFIANKGIDEARAEVDAEIASVMSKTDNGTEWLDQWRAVNKAYGESKLVQANVLHKLVMKPEATAKSIAQALLKYGPALDNTYSDVVSKLPVNTKILVESEIVEQLAKKYTIGKGDGFKVMSFTELSEALKVYKFSSSKAMQLQKAVNEMAEVYRNDRALANVATSLASTDGQILATTIKGKAKMLLAGQMWRRLLRLKGGAKADVGALVEKTTKFLQDPLDARVAERTIKAIGDDMELQAAVKQVQLEAAADLGKGKAKVKIYTDRSGKRYYKAGTGRREVSDTPIAIHRVANGADIEQSLSKPIHSLADLTKVERAKLAKSGFLAIGLDNGVLLKL